MFYYFRFAVFSIGMMLGIHLPAMTYHYEQTVQRKLQVLEPDVARLQRKANTDFYGSIDSLTEFYLASSSNKAMETGQRAAAIKSDYDALQRKAELFSDNFLTSLFNHVRIDYRQTYEGLIDAYHWQPKLTPVAAITGLLLALIVCFLFELIALMLSGLGRSKVDKSVTVRDRRRAGRGRHF